MRLDRAVEHANDARGPRQAARLANDINYELALGDHPPEHQQRGEEALRVLERKFPGTSRRSFEITDPPSLSHRASRRLREEGDRAHSRVRERRGGPATTPAATPPTPDRPPTRRRGPSWGTRAVSRAGRALPTSGWGQTVGDVIVWAIALSIGYLLLTRAAATGKVFLGVTNVVRAIVSPVVDPLNPLAPVRQSFAPAGVPPQFQAQTARALRASQQATVR